MGGCSCGQLDMIGGLGHGSSISHLWHLNFRWLRLNQPSKLRSTGAAGASGSPAFFRPRDHTHVWIAGQLDSWISGYRGSPTKPLTCRWTRRADLRRPPVAAEYWGHGAPSSVAPRVTSSCRSKSCSAP